MSMSSTTFARMNIAVPFERCKHEVFDQRVLEHRLAADEVDDLRRALARRAEPQRPALARLQPAIAAEPVVARTLVALRPGVDHFAGAVAVVGVAALVEARPRRPHTARCAGSGSTDPRPTRRRSTAARSGCRRSTRRGCARRRCLRCAGRTCRRAGVRRSSCRGRSSRRPRGSNPSGRARTARAERTRTRSHGEATGRGCRISGRDH